MNKSKLLFVISIIILLSGIFVYNYMYKDHRNINEEDALYTLESIDLIKEFSMDINASVTKYLDKTIEVKGLVTEKEKDNFTLGENIICYTDSVTLLQVLKNKVVIVKGRSIGYDELLDLIKIDQVSIIND